MKKPILYVQRKAGTRSDILFDFGYSAKLGANEIGIKVKTFEDSSTIPGDPTNIVVGSVEMCSEWLNAHGYGAPPAIDVYLFAQFTGRSMYTTDMNDLYTTSKNIPLSEWKPVFIKPYKEIKAFTGFVVDDPRLISLFSDRFEGEILVQDVIDIVSEYRVYIKGDRIIGVCNYSGDPLIFPDPIFIQECVDFSVKIIDNLSFALDFAVLANGETTLIEANDGWAIGNYGVEPYYYYLFVRDRWLQMTGIRHKTDFR